MIGKIKKLKNNTEYVYPVTRAEAVFVDDNKTLSQRLSEIGTGGGGSEVVIKPWEGKIFNIHGDSSVANTTTLGQSYATLVKNEHKFAGFNSYAVSGYNMGQIYTDYLTQDKNVDLVILGGGGNVYNIGTIDDTVTTSFYGAMNSIVQWHFTNIADVPLIVVITHQVRYIRDVGSVIFNNNGDLRNKRAKAMREIAQKYSLPIVDFWHDLGITAENANTFTTDGTHPNERGYKMMARLVNEKLYKVTPEWYPV